MEEEVLETREEIYEEFDKQPSHDVFPLAPAVTATEEKAENVDEAGKEHTDSETAESTEDGKETQDEAAKESVLDAQKQKQEKFVPLEALHAEREKRKAERARREQLEAEIQSLKNQTVVQPDDVITDYDKALSEANQRIKNLEELESRRVEMENIESQRKRRSNTLDAIDRLNARLEGEGYIGFKQMVGAVSAELQSMVEDDETNVAFDNPTGWEKIFKEKIYPDVRAKILATESKAKLLGKVEAKKNASLATSHGSKPVETESDTEQTDEDYFEMRKKMQAR